MNRRGNTWRPRIEVLLNSCCLFGRRKNEERKKETEGYLPKNQKISFNPLSFPSIFSTVEPLVS